MPENTQRLDPILQRGSVGTQVELLQRALSFDHGAELNSDGVFGQETEDAVKKIQRENGLAPNGIVGPDTREKLELNDKNTPAFQARHTLDLKSGDQGTAVMFLQEKLREKGFNLAVDGKFGSATEEAVRQFQGRRNLTVNGAVDLSTWRELTPELVPYTSSLPSSQQSLGVDAQNPSEPFSLEGVDLSPLDDYGEEEILVALSNLTQQQATV
jgi:peptidoglycan hydrolase-like protein with peptidoglycan-binding domain